MSKSIVFVSLEEILADVEKQKFVKNMDIFAPLPPLSNGEDKDAVQKEAAEKAKFFVQYTSEFWATMPVREGAKEFFDSLKKRFNEVRILSAFSTEELSANRLSETRKLKQDWVLKNIDSNFDKDRVVVTSFERESFVHPEIQCVLIDKSQRNVAAWVRTGMGCANVFKAGADAVQYFNDEQVLETLNQKGFPEKIVSGKDSPILDEARRQGLVNQK